MHSLTLSAIAEQLSVDHSIGLAGEMNLITRLKVKRRRFGSEDWAHLIDHGPGDCFEAATTDQGLPKLVQAFDLVLPFQRFRGPPACLERKVADHDRRDQETCDRDPSLWIFN